jgi:alpha-L-fucosidase
LIAGRVGSTTVLSNSAEVLFPTRKETFLKTHCRIAASALLLFAACAFPSLAQVEGEHYDIVPKHRVASIQETETAAQRDARMAWWREARFGMFIHWGLYSIPAGTWDGKQIPSIGEWIMNNASIPVDDYKALASQFNPTAFSAHDIVALANPPA